MSTTQTETTVRASLNFWKQPKDNQEIVCTPFISSIPDQIDFNRQEIPIYDIRGHEADFTLDKNGFQFVKAPTTFNDWNNDQAVLTEYYKELQEVIMNTTGATRVVMCKYRLRNSQPSPGQEGAAEYAHVDFSYKMAPVLVEHGTERPSDWDTLTKSRWAKMNVWRPLNDIVTRDPLCICDYSTLSDGDLKPYVMSFEGLPDNVRLKGVPRVEGFLVKYSPDGQRWWYKSEMENDEIVFIKNFDSKLDGTARCAPHGAFQSNRDYGEARRSIEVRCLVFWEGESSE